MESIILKLNESLVDADFNQVQFTALLKSVKEQLTFTFLDFEYYNEERLEMAKKAKTENVQVGNFEWASQERDLERECEKHIDYKTKNKLEKSMFYTDETKLWYMYLGNSTNDNKAKKLFLDLISNKK
jgi:hypothetical protein